MIKKLTSFFLASILLLATTACQSNTPKHNVNAQYAAREEIGAAMPEILFAQDDKLAFYSEFGLFVINISDGSIYRSVNLKEIGYNGMTGTNVTRFYASEDYRRIYFFNEGEDELNEHDFFMYYNIEEDVIRQVPVGTEVAIAPDLKALSMEFAGGKQEGYTSSPVVYSDDMVIYLQATDWFVKDLYLCKYRISSQETERMQLFKPI